MNIQGCVVKALTAYSCEMHRVRRKYVRKVASELAMISIIATIENSGIRCCAIFTMERACESTFDIRLQ